MADFGRAGMDVERCINCIGSLVHVEYTHSKDNNIVGNINRLDYRSARKFGIIQCI